MDRGVDASCEVFFPLVAALRMKVAEKVDQLLRIERERLNVHLLALAAEHHHTDARDRHQAMNGMNKLRHLRFHVVDDQLHRSGAVDDEHHVEAFPSQFSNEAAES